MVLDLVLIFLILSILSGVITFGGLVTGVTLLLIFKVLFFVFLGGLIVSVVKKYWLDKPVDKFR